MRVREGDEDEEPRPQAELLDLKGQAVQHGLEVEELWRGEGAAKKGSHEAALHQSGKRGRIRPRELGNPVDGVKL